ncbi:hypothetical protein [Gordonia sp. ABSL49_1]|uniref:hypothetical protein n=1 Tax=Gordonia sp. ABSL49_1 TaxID=2920941 RepID=UPI001F104416|nr:hypothetical protein [Gordonia sp. ABSL49_1]MCH5645124.1 hypothetical protein [Gordonia sp. ABSL49_1]
MRGTINALILAAWVWATAIILIRWTPPTASDALVFIIMDAFALCTLLALMLPQTRHEDTEPVLPHALRVLEPIDDTDHYDSEH